MAIFSATDISEILFQIMLKEEVPGTSRNIDLLGSGGSTLVTEKSVQMEK